MYLFTDTQIMASSALARTLQDFSSFHIRSDQTVLTTSSHNFKKSSTVENDPQPTNINAQEDRPPLPTKMPIPSNISQPYVHPRPPKQILGFTFGKTIGQGSMGKVKLAQNAETGQTVAVKIVPRYSESLMAQVADYHFARKAGDKSVPRPPIDVEYDEQRDMRIVREAFMLQLLKHDNIVELHDFVVTENYYFLIFEYVPGKQLLDFVVTKGRMHANMARQVLTQILQAIKHCHDNSVVHRDLKIENVMMHQLPSGDVNVKVLDFGLGNVYRRDKLLQTFCGSLYFAAPELLQAQPYTGPEVDIWSIGVIAYVLLCGTVPFDDANLATLHGKIKAGNVKYPDHLQSDARAFISSMLCVNVAKRATLEDIMSNPWLSGIVKKAKPSIFQVTHNLTVAPWTQPVEKKVVTLTELPGQHPHPFILQLLKRDPFDTFSDDTDISTPFQCGFGSGFGYQSHEVDNALQSALSYKSFQHPAVSLYILLWNAMMNANPETLPMEASLDSIDIMDTVPQPTTPTISAPRFFSLASFLSAPISARIVTKVSPLATLEAMLAVMHQEGMSVDTYDHRKTTLDGSHLIDFLRDNQQKNGNAWTLQCVYRPSIVLSNAIRFQVEISHVYSEREMEQQPRTSMSGVWFNYLGSDKRGFRQIFQRFCVRCKSIVAGIN